MFGGSKAVTKLVPLAVRLGDRAMTYDVDVRKADRAWFALGVRKSGSSIFSSIVNALAMFNELNTVDIPGTMFEHGLRYPDWNGYDRIADLLWRGNAYIGFRDPPTAFYGDPIFREARKILMVRDPRDALVSEYFSNAYSHSLPSEQSGGSVIERERERALQTSVEQYVLERVDSLNRTVNGYRALVRDKGSNLLVIRYEDVIFDKAAWIRKIARHYDWQASEELIINILGWADVRPETEDQTAFVRRVAPGDHREKLSRPIISRVDRKLSDVWKDLGYAIG